MKKVLTLIQVMSLVLLAVLIVSSAHATPIPATTHPGTHTAPILKEIGKIAQGIVDWLNSF